jgi:hypothetical protein
LRLSQRQHKRQAERPRRAALAAQQRRIPSDVDRRLAKDTRAAQKAARAAWAAELAARPSGQRPRRLVQLSARAAGAAAVLVARALEVVSSI